MKSLLTIQFLSSVIMSLSKDRVLYHADLRRITPHFDELSVTIERGLYDS
jgi:hypothetical protein